MSDAPVPPHHVDWEPQSEFESHAHAELPPGEDERVRAPWRHVLMLGVAAFALWFLLYAPTLQHNAQVSPVGTRRTVSLDVTGPVAAVSRALQLSHIVSITGRGSGLSDGGSPGGLTVAGPHPGEPGHRRVAAEVRNDAQAGRHRAHDDDDGAAQPQGPHRGPPVARPDRRRLHRHRPR